MQKGWLMVDRFSGRITPLNLPLFDSFHTSAAWFRDYTGYCGVSEDGEKLYAMVAQLGRKKPIVKECCYYEGKCELVQQKEAKGELFT